MSNCVVESRQINESAVRNVARDEVVERHLPEQRLDLIESMRPGWLALLS